MQEFDYSLDFKAIDSRQHPELYRIGRGEQGVLLVEPYKSFHTTNEPKVNWEAVNVRYL